MRKTFLLFAAVLTIILYAACSKKYDGANPPADSCTDVDSRFAAKVFPIIQHSCATDIDCHGNGSTEGPGALTNYTQISNASAAIKSAVISGRMPKGSSLATQEKNAIICWVNSGAQNN
jgi:predicted small lipoprotein YifL